MTAIGGVWIRSKLDQIRIVDPPFLSYLPKRKRSYSNHPFSGAMLVLGKVLFFCETRFVFQAVAAGMMLAASTSMLFEVTVASDDGTKTMGKEEEGCSR